MRMRTADVREIRDFRAYLRRRRDDRRAPEWLRYVVVVEPGPEPGSVGLRAGFAAKPGEPGARKIRRDGQPWCPWLGNRTSVATDERLQAAFAALEVEADADPDLWRRLYRAAGSIPSADRMLRRLRDEGARLLRAARERARAQAEGGGRPGRRLPPRPSGGPLQGVAVPAWPSE